MKRCSDYQGRAKVRPGTSCQRIVIVVLGCAFLQNLFNLLVDLHLDFLLHRLNSVLPTKRQRISYLSPMLAVITNAGILTVELRAWIRTLDLPQLGVHTVFIVGVHLRQPDNSLL